MQIEKALLKEKCYFSYTHLKERRANTHKRNCLVKSLWFHLCILVSRTQKNCQRSAVKTDQGRVAFFAVRNLC